MRCSTFTLRSRQLTGSYGDGALSQTRNVTSLQRIVGNIDLLEFFPSIHLGRIVKALQQRPYSLGEDAAVVVGQICCDDTGVLPQGAPSSPILSNIICRGLDDQLQEVARRHGCRYTRYADDITISTSRPSLPTEVLSIDALTGQHACGAPVEGYHFCWVCYQFGQSKNGVERTKAGSDGFDD